MKNLNLIDGDSRSLDEIDWNFIIKEVIKNCHFEKSIKELIKPPAWKDISTIETNLFDMEQTYLRVFQNQHFLLQIKSEINSLKKEDEILFLVNHCLKEGSLVFSEINNIALFIEFFFNVSDKVDYLSFFPLIFNNDIRSVIQKNFIRPLRQFVTKSGQVEYERHPLLKPIYIAIKAIEDEIRSDLITTINQLNKQELLSHEGIDILNERYVIAIRTDRYNSQMGQIIGRSETALTLYVEPYSIRDKCNKRLVLLNELNEKLITIAKEYSVKIADHSSVFFSLIEFVYEFDSFFAKVVFSSDHNFVRPKLNEQPSFSLFGVFHPLIKNCVKNDIILTEEKSGLIISGPNTGGKTVLLKSVCLSYLFLYKGFYIPAKEANMYNFEGIFWFGRDQQNVSEGLSSFSAEVLSYRDFLANLKNSNIAFFDEIFSSTNSDEASALSMALFNYIHRVSKTFIFASTHHQLLKSSIYLDPTYISCHMQFDLNTNRPTYKLVSGTPGSSYAIKIFKNLIQEDPQLNAIIYEAEGYLDPKKLNMEQILERISTSDLELQMKNLELDSLISKTESQKRELKGLFELKLQDELDKKSKLLNEKIKILDNEIVKIRLEKSTNKNRVENIIFDAKKAFQKDDQKSSNTIHNLTFPKQLIIGQKYFSKKFNNMIILNEINVKEKKCFITFGKIKSWVPVNDLFIKDNQKGSSANKSRVEINILNNDSTDITSEIDCRGMRLDEFENLFHRCIKVVLSGEKPFVTLIHGHGDLILKNWLRESLKDFPKLRWDAPKHYNDGATTIYG